MYDITPSKFGQANSLVSDTKQFGERTEVYNGVDMTLNARLAHGAFVSGGVSTGRTETNNCFANGRPDLTPAGFVANTPRVDAYCNVVPPFSANTQLKLNGAYPLPWDMMVSARLSEHSRHSGQRYHSVHDAWMWPNRSVVRCRATSRT